MPEINAQVSSSIEALTREFEIVTHNLANVSTVGYKRRCNAFSESLEKAGTGAEEYSPGEINVESAFDFSQGNLVQTGRNLDFAIFGNGFFVIETPDGPLYTRNGMFRISPTGQIVDSSGRMVTGDGGPIVIPPAAGEMQIYVSGDGTVQAGQTVVGKLRVVDFQDSEGKLVPAGENCFYMPDKNVQPTAAASAVVKQGYQEASNVSVVDELVDMIMVTRLYDANMRFISAQKETSGSILNVAMG
jgi:flagellar basal-body rod protein FlgG